ncbi:transposase, partial [Acetobacterium sp.]|uniref:transposase n=1 Tax=Acetobacterium sp. TaxID=1872094 RepID=UPI00359307F8
LKNGKYHQKSRHVTVYLRHDAVLTDKARVSTPDFTIAYNKRYKIERRFATMVRNHGLRRCRYIRLRGAKIHITMANLACNIVRMVSLLFPPPKNLKTG